MRALRPMKSYLIGLTLSLVATQAFATSANPDVVVTVPPLAPYMEALMQGVGSVHNLLKPGQEPHDFALSPSQREMLSKADIIVIPEKNMGKVIAKTLAQEVARGALVIELASLRGADPLPYAATNPWLAVLKKKPEHAGHDHVHHEAALKARSAHAHEEKHHHDHATQDADAKPLTDPHLWMDPIRMSKLAMPLAEIIGHRSPAMRTQLTGNAIALEAHLRDEVSPAVAMILKNHPIHPNEIPSSKPRIPFITYHAAYQYFLTRYGIAPQGEMVQRPEEYLGGTTLHGVMGGAQSVRIRCIISEAETPMVKRVAAASGARMVTLSPEAIYGEQDAPDAPWVRNGYDRLLLKTATSFAECL